MPTFTYNASGTVILSGHGSSTATYLTTVTNSFTWSYDKCVSRWYRIDGRCQKKAGDSCSKRFVAEVMACSVDEACQKLTSQGFVRSINKILLYPNYVSKSVQSGLGVTVKDPLDYVDVTPSLIGCRSCCPLLSDVTADATVGGNAGMTATFSFLFGGRTNVDPVDEWFFWNELPNELDLFGSGFAYNATGTVNFGSNSTVTSSQINANMTVGVNPAVSPVGSLFSDTAAPPIDFAIETIVVPCCVTPIPTVLHLYHNLDRLSFLSQFLVRNGLVLPGVVTVNPQDESIKLGYSSRFNSWRNSLHFTGISPDDGNNHSWDLSFELACTASDVLTTFGTYVWVFTLTIRNTNVDTGAKSLSRLVVTLPLAEVCRESGQFNGASFQFNVQNQLLKPAVGTTTFVDKDLMFARSSGFTQTPLLIIHVVAVAGSVSNHTFRHYWDRQMSAATTLVTL